MNDYNGVLLEDLRDKLDTILEGLAAMASVPGDVRQLKEDTGTLKQELVAIKLAVTDHNTILAVHENRITRLEVKN